MKTKNLIKSISFMLCLIISMIFLFSCNNNELNDLSLPQKEQTEKIEVKHNEETFFITDKEEISKLIDAFQLAKLTKQKSVQDFPTTSDDYYLLCFKDKNNEEIYKIFAYKKGKKYYIEKPYQGIYRIADEEFNLLTNK